MADEGIPNRVLAFTVGLLISTVLGIALSSILIPTTTASIEESAHSYTLYDSSAPGVSTNQSETFCIQDLSGFPDFNESYWAGQIESWLNDLSSWGALGVANVNFDATSCSSCDDVVFCIEFYAAGDPQFCSGIPAGGCAGYRSGTILGVDGHDHNLRGKIHLIANDWRCTTDCDPDLDDDKKRIVNHEMGHLLGEGGHDRVEDMAGPEFGVANDRGIWDGDWFYNPVPGEIDRVRAHLDGEPARPAVPCVGFPENDRIHVSWFDAATDETQHKAELSRIADDPPIGHLFDMEQGAGDFNSRVAFLSGQRSDVSSPSDAVFWVVDSQVYGGPRDEWNSNTLSAFSYTGGDGRPSLPCSVKVEATGPYGLAPVFRTVGFLIDHAATSGVVYSRS